MYKFGKLAFLTGKGTAGLGKCGSLSHLESLFDIFRSFSSLFYGTQNLILPLLFWFYQTHLEVTDNGFQSARRSDHQLCNISFFSFAGSVKMWGTEDWAIRSSSPIFTH